MEPAGDSGRPADARPPMIRRHGVSPALRRHRIDLHVPAAAIFKVVIAIALVVITVKLWFAFLLFLVAVLFAVTLDPVVRRLERRGVKRDIGVLALAVASVVAISAAVVLVAPPLFEELGVLVRDFAGTRDRIERDFPADSPILKALVSQILAFPGSLEVREWFGRPLVWGRFAVEVVSGGTVVLMLALYLLADGKRTYAWLLSHVPRRHRGRVAQTVPAVTEVVRAYVRGQCITSILCGAYTFAVLSILGVPAALPLALAAAVLDVIPILGTVVMTVAATLTALTVSPFAAVAVFVGYLLYHLVENYLIAPRVYGRNLRLSTLSVMLALFVGGILQGVLGAVLVLPLVAAYPIIERIWLRKYLGTDVVTDHTALAASAGTSREKTVEKRVLRGEPQDAVPPIETPPGSTTAEIELPGAPAGARP
jgi:predicted PurR-regulated permease PerM